MVYNLYIIVYYALQINLHVNIGSFPYVEFQQLHNYL